MYEIKKLKVVNFATVWMLVVVANYLVFGVIYIFFFMGIVGILGDSSIFGNYGYNFLIGYLIGLVTAAILSFLGGLLTAAIYNLISTKLGKGLQIDIVHLVEKKGPPPDKK